MAADFDLVLCQIVASNGYRKPVWALICNLVFLVQNASGKGQTLDVIEEMHSPDLCKEHDDIESVNNGSETGGRRNR